MLVVFAIEDILYVQYATFFPLYGLATGHFQYSMEEEGKNHINDSIQAKNLTTRLYS